MGSRGWQLAVAALLAFASAGFPQGLLLEKGKSGYWLSGGYASVKELETLGGSVGYSHKGVLDIDFGIARTSAPAPQSSLTSLGPSISFHIVKQKEPRKMSAAIGASYGFSTTGEDRNRTKIEVSSVLLGITVYGRETPGDFALCPQLTLGRIFVKANRKNAGRTVETSRDSFNLLVASMYFCLVGNRRTMFYIAPGFSKPFESLSNTMPGSFLLEVGWVLKSK